MIGYPNINVAAHPTLIAMPHKNAPVATSNSGRGKPKTLTQIGVISMTVLPKPTRVCKLNSLPLFEWAEKNQTPVFHQLLITQKLARHLNMPASIFNAKAEANGYTGRDTDQ